MRILVLSDSHGDIDSLYKSVNAQPDAKVVFFLGDGANDALEAASNFPDRQFYCVKGNNDFASTLPLSGLEIVENTRIFYTHGHAYNDLILAARSSNADILLYGHTHKALTDYRDGLYIMNPGSLCYLMHGFISYGIIDITDAGIVLNTVKI